MVVLVAEEVEQMMAIILPVDTEQLGKETAVEAVVTNILLITVEEVAALEPRVLVGLEVAQMELAERVHLQV
jgi:hypothetical protein